MSRSFLECIINSYKNGVWTDENPHATLQQGQQQRLSCGTVHDRLTGHYVLLQALRTCLQGFMEQSLPEWLDHVLLQFRRGLWFVHDGVPTHSIVFARELPNPLFSCVVDSARWSFFWPARSPDLNTFDIFVWEHLRYFVYETPDSM
jgi:hypothetical protein